MKVSIIIPAYNEENYIEATIQAALKQDYPDIEIIVVDNNSTDATREKVRQFPQVKLVEEKTSGVQWARERGRKEAKGEIIGNLDADCLARPDWVSKAVKYFSDPRVVLITGPYYYYDASLFLRLLTSFTQKVVYKIYHDAAQMLFGKVVAVGGNLLFRAKVFEEIGGYDTSIVFYGDDTNTGNRLAKKGKVLFKNDMEVPSSSRRFKKFGTMYVFWKYTINYFWMILFKKPYEQDNDGF